ncbi:MAG: hypothetical protein ACRDS0_30165 [Pseudonocardiaceae bacterium]
MGYLTLGHAAVHQEAEDAGDVTFGKCCPHGRFVWVNHRSLADVRLGEQSVGGGDVVLG